MEEALAQYTLAVVVGFVLAKWFVENVKFHLRTKRWWIHHWFLAAASMTILYLLEIFTPLLWGGLCGVALEGLMRKNWSLKRQ